MRILRTLPLLVVGLLRASLFAQDLFVTESVSMSDARSLQVEFRPTVRGDQFSYESNKNLEYTATLTRMDVNARWVPAEKWEALLEAPYVSNTLKVEGSGADTSESDSGLGQVILGGKHAFRPGFGVALRVELPTADSDKLLGEGLNVGLALLGEKESGAWRFYGNAGFLVKGKYESTFDIPNGRALEVDPGDVFQVNGALTRQAWGLKWLTEMNVNVIDKASIDSAQQADSEGTTIDLIFGSGKAFGDNLFLKMGIAVGLGEEKSRGFDLTRSAGDLKALLAITYHSKSERNR